jgi:hypothetical protein
MFKEILNMFLSGFKWYRESTDSLWVEMSWGWHEYTKEETYLYPDLIKKFKAYYKTEDYR